MEKPQSAIEWLMNQITFEEEDENNPEGKGRFASFQDYVNLKEYFDKAIAMEKEQIIDAYEYGYWRGNNEDDLEPEEYYKNPYCNPNNKYYGK